MISPRELTINEWIVDNRALGLQSMFVVVNEYTLIQFPVFGK
jgi:hypothetical protein